MQKSYKRENIIGFADVDYQERLRPFRVFELLEDISDAHANILEIGAQSPVMEGYVWVVARNRYRLTRMPRLGEKITFETWPGQCQRAIYPRLFSMTDESGCRIGGVQRIDERFGFVELRLLFTVVPRKTEEYDTDDQ